MKSVCFWIAVVQIHDWNCDFGSLSLGMFECLTCETVKDPVTEYFRHISEISIRKLEKKTNFVNSFGRKIGGDELQIRPTHT